MPPTENLYPRMVRNSFAPREGALKYIDELLRLEIGQFAIIYKDRLWWVCNPIQYVKQVA